MKSPDKNYLEQLQGLDEPMKRRVLVAVTAIVMVAVVYIWVGYFNNIVMKNQQGQLADQAAIAQNATDTAQNANASANLPGFWQQLGGAFASAYKSIAGDIKNLSGSLQGPREYTITPQQ